MAGRFSNNSFGGGGGFMKNEDGGGAGGDTNTSPSRKDAQNKSIVPLTIHQVINAQQVVNEDKYKVDGVELAQVTVVGVIRSINQQAANTIYMIEDGTGVFEFREFVPTEEAEHLQLLRKERREEQYVRVIGQVRSFKDKRSVQIYHMRPIVDFNELTFHLLEVIQVHLLHTRGAPTAAMMAAAASSSNGAVPHGGHVSSFTAGLAGMPAGTGPVPMVIDHGGFTPLQSKIVNALRTLGSGTNGVHIDEIIRSLHPEPAQRIRDAVEWLSAEGHAFSTTDEHHFKSTDD